MNILALIGVIFALAGTVFGILEAVVKEFVEVFLPLDDSDDPVLSCRIGNLGVYSASYDPTCLSADDLDKSNLPTEPFSAPTTEFKLLFPAQQEFIKDILPINEELILLFGANGGLSEAQVNVLLGILDAATPEFTSCEEYMPLLQAGQLALFNTFDGLLTTALIQQAVTPTVQGLADGLVPALGALRAPPGPQNAILGVLLGLLARVDLDACGITNETTTIGGAEACLQGQFLTAAGVAATAGTLATAALLQGLSPRVESSCNNILTCFIVNVELTLTTDILESFSDPRSLCNIFDSVENPCDNMAQLSGFISVVLQELLVLDALSFQGLVGLVGPAFGAIAITGRYFGADIFGFDDAAVLTFLNVTLSANLASNFYPTSFDDTDFRPCIIQSLAEDLLESTLGTRFDEIPDFGDNCTLLNFLTAAGTLLQATQPTSAFGPLLEDLLVLYDACSKIPGIQGDPSLCKNFFPSLFLSGAYSFGLDLSVFSGTGDDVFEEAVEKCKDDEVDIKKISAAQKLVPVAIVSLGLGAVAGGVAVVTNNVVAVISACALSLAGGVLNLAALLNVQSAPIYEVVGEDPVELSPLYQAGITQVYGLICIACGVVASILFGISLLPCLKGEPTGDVKEALTVKT